ncbi:G3ST4 sulfotransferase, partial [Rhipidura dahli]|nr:G3ST4 sulfotransferase [Rhipidura dahli]
ARAAPRSLSEEQKRRWRAWNGLDWALYSHMNRSFWRKAERFGLGRLAEEVAELRKRREALSRSCLRGGGPVPAELIPERSLRPFQPPGGSSVLGFALREGLQEPQRSLCRRMAMPELQYKDLLERKQFGTGNGTWE